VSVHVEHLMGTVVGVDIRDEAPEQVVEPAVAAFFSTLHDLERRFSPWIEDSEISRIGRGELAEADAAPDVRWVLAACDHLAESTDGAFDARRHSPERGLDPSALVKGWAVDEAARHLDDAGLRRYAVNAGGDIRTRGEPAAGSGWRVGIRHPAIVDHLAAVLEVRNLAVATSGLYERDDHIRDGRTGRTPVGLRSLTVVGPELTWADAYATAAFIMGVRGLAWVHGHPGYGALAITGDDRVVWTPAIGPLLTNLSDHDAAMVDMEAREQIASSAREAQS
jgi:FAD:protein FMN transferase